MFCREVVLRNRFIIVLFLFLLCISGCWHRTQPTGPDVNNNAEISNSVGVAPSVQFRIVLPDQSKVKEIPAASFMPSIRASDPTSAKVVFKLTLVNIGNAAQPTITLIKNVVPNASGCAEVNFTSVPALTCVADIHIEGGNIEGFTDFHGATDLSNSQINIVNLAPKGGRSSHDFIASLIMEIVASPELFQKVASGLVARVKAILPFLDMNSANAYTELTELFRASDTRLLTGKVLPGFIAAGANVTFYSADGQTGTTVTDSEGSFAFLLNQAPTAPIVYRAEYFLQGTASIKAGCRASGITGVALIGVAFSVVGTMGNKAIESILNRAGDANARAIGVTESGVPDFQTISNNRSQYEANKLAIDEFEQVVLDKTNTIEYRRTHPEGLSKSKLEMILNWASVLGKVCVKLATGETKDPSDPTAVAPVVQEVQSIPYVSSIAFEPQTLSLSQGINYDLSNIKIIETVIDPQTNVSTLKEVTDKEKYEWLFLNQTITSLDTNKIQEGNYTLTCICSSLLEGQITGNLQLTVKRKTLKGITLNPSSVTIHTNQEYDLSKNVTVTAVYDDDSNANITDVTWTGPNISENIFKSSNAGYTYLTCSYTENNTSVLGTLELEVSAGRFTCSSDGIITDHLTEKKWKFYPGYTTWTITNDYAKNIGGVLPTLDDVKTLYQADNPPYYVDSKVFSGYLHVWLVDEPVEETLPFDAVPTKFAWGFSFPDNCTQYLMADFYWITHQMSGLVLLPSTSDN